MSHSERFPYAGKSFVIKFSDDLVFKNTYSDDGETVTAEFLAGAMIGTKMTMPFRWSQLPGDNYLLSWQEKDKSTVVHCDNFEAKQSQAYYTTMDGSFYVMRGEIEISE